MKKKLVTLFCLMLFVVNTKYVHAQKIDKQSAPNLIIVTTDGLRWQEVFKGIDDTIANNRNFFKKDSLYIKNKYNARTVEERRKKLLPFFWNTIASEGFIYGNRDKKNNVDVANSFWFSYPGYSELFTGFVDTAINTNAYRANPNTNILAYLNKQKEYKNKVIAFGAWNAFDRILNEKISGFPVISAYKPIATLINDSTSQLLSTMLANSYKLIKEEECLDVFTHYQALHYLKKMQPKVMFIGYGETDEWAHEGNYSNYLDAANQVDKWISEIWHWIQSTQGYKNNTYLLITTDHGRGLNDQWVAHGKNIEGSSNTWFALLGPEMSRFASLGEQITHQEIKTSQLASSIIKLLGFSFFSPNKVGTAIY
jgi:hypothetical protein